MSASPMPARRADATTPTPPIHASCSADAEIREPDRLAVPICDPGRFQVEVELLLHPSESRLVDVHRHEVALVRGREELRTLAQREHVRGAELDAQVRSRRTIPSLEARRVRLDPIVTDRPSPRTASTSMLPSVPSSRSAAVCVSAPAQ